MSNERAFVVNTTYSAFNTPRAQQAVVMYSYWAATLGDGAARIVVPLYFATLGYSPINIGIMFVCYELFGLLANFFSGFLINRIGYRSAFLLALIMHSAAGFGYLIFDPSLALIPAMLLIGLLRACRGIGEQLIKTTSSAWIKQLAPKNNKLLPIQTLLGGNETAKGIGLLAGGFCFAWLGFQITLALFGVLTLIAALCAAQFLGNINEKRKVSYRNFFSVKKEMRVLAIARAFLYAGRDIWLVIAVPIALTQGGVSAIETSAILAAGFIIFGITQPFFARLLKAEFDIGNIIKKKWRYRSILPLATASLSLVPLLALPAQNSLPVLLAIVLIYHVLAGLATVPHNHLHLKYASRKSASVDIAYYKTVAHIGKVIAVLASGILLQYTGLSGCIIAASFCLIASSALSTALTIAARTTVTGNKEINIQTTDEQTINHRRQGS